MAAPGNDKYMDRILSCMLAEEYQEAIAQCNHALGVYETIRQGLLEYKRSLSGIRESSMSMRGAAESAEQGLKDEIGDMIIRVVREYSQNIIDICLAAGDTAAQDDTDVGQRMEYVRSIRTRAIALAAEKEQKEREARQGSRHGYRG